MIELVNKRVCEVDCKALLLGAVAQDIKGEPIQNVFDEKWHRFHISDSAYQWRFVTL